MVFNLVSNQEKYAKFSEYKQINIFIQEKKKKNYTSVSNALNGRSGTSQSSLYNPLQMHILCKIIQEYIIFTTISELQCNVPCFGKHRILTSVFRYNALSQNILLNALHYSCFHWCPVDLQKEHATTAPLDNHFLL